MQLPPAQPRPEHQQPKQQRDCLAVDQDRKHSKPVGRNDDQYRDGSSDSVSQLCDDRVDQSQNRASDQDRPDPDRQFQPDQRHVEHRRSRKIRRSILRLRKHVKRVEEIRTRVLRHPEFPLCQHAHLDDIGLIIERLGEKIAILAMRGEGQVDGGEDRDGASDAETILGTWVAKPIEYGKEICGDRRNCERDERHDANRPGPNRHRRKRPRDNPPHRRTDDRCEDEINRRPLRHACAIVLCTPPRGAFTDSTDRPISRLALRMRNCNDRAFILLNAVDQGVRKTVQSIAMDVGTYRIGRPT